ncbi:PfkB family carbohydrate kinase [Gordonia humi]|uniref:Ribokinase n=1 Tax=Gordonia humi TaxID=686429 RepID=A0A840ESF8_9ACTN|nr:PfkB family carbohydrate kinase [Gordonia humi]MBB4135795.1 ribokinase [Gordonia humi]
MTSIVVVGSINLDVACSCERFPGPGETVPGDRIAYGRGGKGANQAAAAARAGAATTFIGAVGDDGARVLDSLGDVDLRVTRVPGPTGTAVITVDGRGENTIVVVPGANALLSLTDDDRRVVADADVLLMQSEVPVPVVLDAARAARAGGTTVILNPSPVRDLPDELWSLVDVVVVNESEASASASHLARIPTVVTTFGANGAALRSPDGEFRVDGIAVDVVDTTGAGDAFTGTLAASWDLPPAERLARANTAGARATTVAGA